MNINTAVIKLIPQEFRKIKQPHWVNDKNKNLLDERRESKSDPEKYSRIQKEIQKQYKCAKKQWLEEKSQEIERFKDTNIKE